MSSEHTSPGILSACLDWQHRVNLVSPNVYPFSLDPSCTNSNWWAYSEEECLRLLTILRERHQRHRLAMKIS